MKKILFAIFAVAVLLLGMTGCSKDDNPSTIDISAMEQELVGLWWDEFEYADVTEEDEPFSRVLLVVEVDAEHTGCIYLGVFDDMSDEPLAIYGGPEDAGFTWRLLENGKIVLGDPETGETSALARLVVHAVTQGNGGSYGDNMTNTSNINLTYSNGSVTATNGSYSGTLAKADAEKAADIEQKLRTIIQSNVGLESGGNTPEDFDEDDMR